VVKSFSKTPAIIINIELVTLFTLFLVHICWHSRQVDKKNEKKFAKKKLQNFREIAARQILLMKYCYKSL
jgi:predicted membrane channel-forming protein YqfA (hemolysin III family)